MVEVFVCIGSSCHLKGSYNVVQTFQQLVEEGKLHDQIELKGQFCMKRCQCAVSVTVDGEVYSVKPENARTFFRETILPRLKLL